MSFILITFQVVMPDLATLGAIGIDPFTLELECAEGAEEPQELKELCWRCHLDIGFDSGVVITLGEDIVAYVFAGVLAFISLFSIGVVINAPFYNCNLNKIGKWNILVYYYALNVLVYVLHQSDDAFKWLHECA